MTTNNNKSSNKRESPAANWCLTCFAVDAPLVFDEAAMSYLVYQKEISPETGRPHFQGYVQLAKKLRLAQIKLLFPEGTHFERQRARLNKDAADYCKKDASRAPGEEPYEHGVMTAKGGRSDLAEVCAKVISGVPMEEIMEEDPSTYVRNYRGLAELRTALTPHRNFKTDVIIIWGATGTGKTRYVHDREENLFTKSDPKWWCGYAGHEAVLMDDVVWPAPGVVDFHLHEMTRQQVLQLFDRYPYQVPIKGSSARFVAKRLYLTSNFDPQPWLDTQPEVARRVTEILHFEGMVPWFQGWAGNTNCPTE
ncbi:replication-associated protein [Capybara virus 7_cap1_536]|nr:replication-associated protein [Capybara virus 7_cap1_536]QDJ95261.1 replication-associated protein [Capybara virus 27_cap1_2563]